jgi:hypothetical protein
MNMFSVLVENGDTTEWVDGLRARSSAEAMENAEKFVKGCKALRAIKVKRS